MYKLREVVIETTKKCNLNCIHCGSDCKYATTNNELSIREWQGIIFQLSEMKVEKIVFSGGEPTLKKGFEELLSCAGTMGLKFGFISNGLLPFEDFLQRVIGRYSPFAVGLSIDGLKKNHNKIRRNDNSWTGLMQNISILQRIGIEICAVTTLNKMNFRELVQLSDFLNLIEVDSWQLQLAMPSGRMKSQKHLLLQKNDFREICEKVLSLRSLYPDLNIQCADCFGLAPENSIRSDLWSGCTAGISSMAIDACGNIMPCLSLQDGAERENFKARPIAQIWEDSPVFNINRKFSSKEARGKCIKCVYLDQCRGGCNSQSFSYYGYYHGSPFCFIRSFYGNNKKRRNA
jgi:radical SAM protein with 4Fe4S-binding SPASM domain